MPPKAKMPAPIDRPLSRAYLRQFKGWSTAYPPGVSDPASLRVMENLMVNRDGSVRVRPGLQLLTRGDGVAHLGGLTLVGAFEPFYLNDGSKAYLVAVREGAPVHRVTFRVLKPVGSILQLSTLTDVGIGFDVSAWGVDPPGFSLSTDYVRYVQIDNRILAMSDNGEPVIVFHVGATKKVTKPASITGPVFGGGATCTTYLTTPDWLTNDSDTDTLPPEGLTNTANSLSSSDPSLNVYNLAFWYTYTNELGESTPSEVWSTQMQRPWGAWLREEPFAAAPGDAPHPNGVPVTDPRKAADHVIVRLRKPAEFAAAVAAGATKMNLYMMTWSNQSPVPVEGLLLVSRDLPAGAAYDTHGWFHVHPGCQPLGGSMPIPTKDNRTNTSDPSKAAQGIVAADRLVLVNDKTEASKIRWTGATMGDYLNFSASRGGGVKTLTAGNLQVPACVKLWQNPQSADTIIVLCMGTDGYSTSYYMMPASVTSQSDNTLIMGFEETTATPGTVSPYGCEVANNALYHPLDDQLMKSTASNYNINHKSMTDLIANRWRELVDKEMIVSCFFDQRLYFLVHNPAGAALEEGCRGNEVWVLDLASEGGTWSRWLTQGVSLRKLMVSGLECLGLVRPEGLFAFRPDWLQDNSLDPVTGLLSTQPIPWRMETNTQGANRAHDAWAHLRQVSLTTGNFEGVLRFGVKGKDLHGKDIDVSKLYRQGVHTGGEASPFDAEDHLRVAREMKEWFFYAESVDDQLGSGQISLVQYRYTPVSVNVGYDWGTVESFEYGRAAAGSESYTDNGTPQPYLDTSRP